MAHGVVNRGTHQQTTATHKESPASTLHVIVANLITNPPFSKGNERYQPHYGHYRRYRPR